MSKRLDLLSAAVLIASVLALIGAGLSAHAYAGIGDYVLPGDSPLDRCPAYRPTCHVDLRPGRHHHGRTDRHHHGRTDRRGRRCTYARRAYRARHHGRTTCRRARADLRWHLQHGRTPAVVGPFTLNP